jgi:hypothetical protein
MGKGSSRRPRLVTEREYAARWDEVFRSEQETTCVQVTSGGKTRNIRAGQERQPDRTP